PQSRGATSRGRSRPRPRARPRTRGARRGGPSCRELLEEAEVVLVEQPDVVHAILEHRDALDAGAEREAGVALRVVADGFEYRRMNHAAAEDLQPAGVLADGAAVAAATLAADVHLGARFGIGKEAR